MGWFIALAIILLFLLYPLRIRVQVSCHNTVKAALYWHPLPFLKKKPKIRLYQFQTRNPLAAKMEGEKEEEVEKGAESPAEQAKKEKAMAKKAKVQAKKKKRAAKKSKAAQEAAQKGEIPFDWKCFVKNFPWKKALDKSLKTGNLEELKLHLVLIGNPAYACLGGGILWMNLGLGLGILSTKLNHFPAKPNINIVWREKGFEAEAELLFMIRLVSGIRFSVYLLYILLKERRRCKNEGRQSNRRFAEYGNGKPA